MKKERTNRDRRGSAIILCLAVLSLMLVLAMVFAFDARSSSAAAQNHSRIIRARLLNESGVSRVIAVIDGLLSSSSMYRDHTFLSPGRFFQDGGDDNRIRYQYNWKETRYLFSYATDATNYDDKNQRLAATFKMPSGDGDPVNLLPGGYDALHNNFNYINVLSRRDSSDDGDGTSSMGNFVIGRFAYIAFDQTGLLDPSQVGVTAGTRTGASMTEVGMEDGLFYNTSNPSARTFRIDHAADYVSDSWLYYGDFYRGAPVASLEDEDQGYLLRRVLCPGTIPDSEVFWVDGATTGGATTDMDSTCDDDEIFDREDIAALATSTAIGAANLYRFLINSDPSVTAISDTRASPWLRYCGSDYFTSPVPPNAAKAWRRTAAQLALNMMDYADKERVGIPEKPRYAYISSTDGTMTQQGFDLTTVPSTAPANVESVVYGIEKGLGIDEIIVKTQGLNFTPGAGVNDTVDIQTTFEFRMTNPMGNSTGGQVIIEYDLLVTGAASALDPTATSPVGGVTIPVNVGGGNTFTGSLSHTLTIPLNNTGGASTYSVRRIRINKMRAYSDDGDGLRVIRQYPLFRNGSTSDAWFSRWDWDGDSYGSGATPTPTYATHLKAKDPLFTDIDPCDAGASDYWTVVGGVGSLAAEMKKSASPSVGAASSSYSTLEYSQAECKNGAFARVGELGRVHHPYRQNKSVRFWINDTGTDGNWQDAFLLDMFKVGADVLKPGKISINGFNQGVYQAVFTGVGLAGTPETALLGKNGATGGNPFMFRGEIYKIFDGNSLAASTTADKQAEEGIQKVIEFFTTRQNYYTICVTSQSLKGIGGTDLTSKYDNCVKWKSGTYAFVESTVKTVTSVYRDAWKKKCTILRTDIIEDQ